MMIKICTKCGLEKDTDAFPFEKKGKGGKSSRCRMCKNEYRRIWGKKNYDPIKQSERGKQWRKDNREKHNERCSRWVKKNPEKRLKIYRNWKKNNIEKCHTDLKKWHKDNPTKYSEYGKKRRSSIKGRLNANISTSICMSLRGNKNGWHWEDLVGYTLEELKDHLEKQFAPGMTWKNHSVKGWTIDHRIPINAFNFETPFDLDFRQCWALRNLRPMWASENFSKCDKIDSPHQPSLLLQTATKIKPKVVKPVAKKPAKKGK